MAACVIPDGRAKGISSAYECSHQSYSDNRTLHDANKHGSLNIVSAGSDGKRGLLGDPGSMVPSFYGGVERSKSASLSSSPSKVMNASCSSRTHYRQGSDKQDDVRTAEFCAPHAKRVAVDVYQKRCAHPDCVKKPSYGLKGSRKAEFCAGHAREEMVDVVSKRCYHPGCNMHPSFGVEGSGLRMFCAGHAMKGMVPLKKRCGEPGCNKQPSYGVEGSKTADFCAPHAKDGMVDVGTKRKTCIHPGCTKNPSYGEEGKKTAYYCAPHATEGMVNVAIQRCSHPSCDKRQSYGVEGSKTTVFCAVHALEGMVDIFSKRCRDPGCPKLPSYGVEGSRVRIFCAGHAKDGMVSVIKKKRCAHPGCTKQPSYGVEGSRVKTFCAQHAEDGMINLTPHRPRVRKDSSSPPTSRPSAVGVKADRKRKDRAPAPVDIKCPEGASQAAEGSREYPTTPKDVSSLGAFPAAEKLEVDAAMPMSLGAAGASRRTTGGSKHRRLKDAARYPQG